MSNRSEEIFWSCIVIFLLACVFLSAHWFKTQGSGVVGRHKIFTRRACYSWELRDASSFGHVSFWLGIFRSFPLIFWLFEGFRKTWKNKDVSYKSFPQYPTESRRKSSPQGGLVSTPSLKYTTLVEISQSCHLPAPFSPRLLSSVPRWPGLILCWMSTSFLCWLVFLQFSPMLVSYQPS